MTNRAVKLLDVLAPPENHWLKELVRRKADLPAGVHVVRFGDADDEFAEESEGAGAKAGQRKQVAA